MDGLRIEFLGLRRQFLRRRSNYVWAHFIGHTGNATLFFASMIMIVLGTGLLKPNVSSIVGEIYSEQDNRRDAAFSIFYMGINLGGFISPLIVGAVGMNNFHLGFSIAAVGMFIGLVVYVVTRTKNLGLAGTIVRNLDSSRTKEKIIYLDWHWTNCACCISYGWHSYWSTHL